MRCEDYIYLGVRTNVYNVARVYADLVKWQLCVLFPDPC